MKKNYGRALPVNLVIYLPASDLRKGHVKLLTEHFIGCILLSVMEKIKEDLLQKGKSRRMKMVLGLLHEDWHISRIIAQESIVFPITEP